MDEQTYTLEQVTEMVNAMPFPAAVVGNIVWQYGFRFVLTETGWVPAPQE